jgi:hypothetical protein
LGAAGCLYSDGMAAAKVPAAPIAAVDTTAARDAFNAANASNRRSHNLQFCHRRIKSFAMMARNKFANLELGARPCCTMKRAPASQVS